MHISARNGRHRHWRTKDPRFIRSTKDGVETLSVRLPASTGSKGGPGLDLEINSDFVVRLLAVILNGPDTHLRNAAVREIMRLLAHNHWQRAPKIAEVIDVVNAAADDALGLKAARTRPLMPIVKAGLRGA